MFGWSGKTKQASKADDSTAAGLRSTKSYIYFPKQKLGDGATSSVYLGRAKKNGDKVAMKVFNPASFQRPDEVQDREFEVLHKLKQENVVRLLAIEEDTSTKQRVLVMELCDCSVLDMLQQPAYYFGFRETEFLIILQDITAGMKYLQDMDIVHRDIKPGNIMRRFGPDKKPSFKLADFGAARELEEGQQFMSLYGTEEYLHPDMYGRALLKKAPTHPFTANVDLWSLGVTIYHIATGTLPFRPFGGRNNKKTMYEMTTKKLPGVISAVQTGPEHSSIEYGTELPAHCHLSNGFRQLVTPLLAGLLESDPNKMWSFQTYFTATQRIFAMKIIDVFCVEKSQLLKIYNEPDFTLAEVQEQIAEQTNIPAGRQILSYEGKWFVPESSVNCQSYPETSERSPIIIWTHGGVENTSDPALPPTPSMPSVSTGYYLADDYATAHLCVAVTMFLSIRQRMFFILSDLYHVVAKTRSDLVKSYITELKYHYAQMNSVRIAMDTLILSKQHEVVNIVRLLECYRDQSNGNRMEFEKIFNNLVSVREEISEQKKQFNLIEIQHQRIERQFNDVTEHVANLITTWDPGQVCAKSDRCSERLQVFLEDMGTILEQFRADKKTGRLQYNDEQIHKMAKQKLREISTETSTLVQDHCRGNFTKSHKRFSKWFSSASETKAKVDDLDEQLTPVVKQLNEFQLKTKQVSEKWTIDIDESISKLSVLLKKPTTPILQRQEARSVESDDIETDGCLTNYQKDTITRSPHSIDYFDDSTHRNRRMISVSRALKKELKLLGSDSTDINVTVQQSRQLLQEFENLTLNVTSLELSDIEISDRSDDEIVDTKPYVKF